MDAQNPFPCVPEAAARYTAEKIRTPIKIDGYLNESAWRNAVWSPRFVDIITGAPTAYDTHAAVLWDDEYLYIGFKVQEPRLFSTFTKENDPVWQENDVEVFIAGKDAYYEFEISPLGTTYQVFFMWEDAYEKNGYSKIPELAKNHPDMKPFPGVNFTNHPRGERWGAWGYRMPGLKTAVHYEGTMNIMNDTDVGWTAELAFPWKALEVLAKADGRSSPPRNGDVWRMDFSRFNMWKAPEPSNDSGGWMWTLHGEWDSHIPECFAYIEFQS